MQKNRSFCAGAAFLLLGIMLIFWAVSFLSIIPSSAAEGERIQAIRNSQTMEGTPATDIVPAGHTGEDCAGGAASSVVCNQLGWRPFPAPLDLSGLNKEDVVFDLWIYLSDRQGIDGVPYSANNIGFAFANDITNWDDRKYIPWFPTRAELTPESGGMGDGWNHISVKLSLLPEDRAGQFDNLDMSSIYIYVMCTTIDDLYLHDVYFTENAQQTAAVQVYHTQGFTDEDRPLPKTMSLDTDFVSLETGDEYTLQASVRPYSSIPEMRYSSDNTGVASVDSDGVITAVGEGECIVTAQVTNVSPHIIAKVRVSVADTIPINTQHSHTINPDTALRGAAFAADYEVNGVLIKGSSGIFDFAPDGDGCTIFAHFYSAQSAGSLDSFNIKSYTLKHIILEFNLFIADKSDLSYGDAYSGFRLSPPTTLATWGTDYYRAPITQDMYSKMVSGWNRIAISFSYFEKVGNPDPAALSFLVTQDVSSGTKDFEIGFNDVRIYEGDLGLPAGQPQYVVEPLTEYKRAESITISGGNTVVRGKSLQLTAAAQPEDATMAPYIVFESSDESVASVTKNGLVYANAAGTATITAKTLDGETAQSIEITVTGNTGAPTGLILSGIEGHPEVGDVIALHASFEPQDATDTDLVYHSSDLSVAVVDSAGNVTVVGDGRAVITAYSVADPSITASVELETGNYSAARAGMIAGITAGSVVGAALIGVGVFLGFRYMRKKRAAAADAGQADGGQEEFPADKSMEE